MSPAKQSSADSGPAISRVQYRVLFADTDSLGIVYYGNYLKYFEVGRAEWFREFMKPFNNFVENDFYLVVLEAHSTYKKPAIYDQLLTIETRITEIDRVRLRIDYRIFSPEKDLLTEGYTTHAATGKNGRIKRLPQDFIAQVKKLADL